MAALLLITQMLWRLPVSYTHSDKTPSPFLGSLSYGCESRLIFFREFLLIFLLKLF